MAAGRGGKEASSGVINWLCHPSELCTMGPVDMLVAVGQKTSVTEIPDAVMGSTVGKLYLSQINSASHRLNWF